MLRVRTKSSAASPGTEAFGTETPFATDIGVEVARPIGGSLASRNGFRETGRGIPGES
jgi:hypothetical protein